MELNKNYEENPQRLPTAQRKHKKKKDWRTYRKYCCISGGSEELLSEEEEVVTAEELLDEEFHCYMRVAKSLMKKMERPKDKEICAQLIKRCERLNESNYVDVQIHTNEFVKYLLKVINWNCANQPLNVYAKWFDKNCDDSKNDMKRWIQPNKSYMAMKTLCDGTVIFYSAVSHNPNAGWHDGALGAFKNARIAKTTDIRQGAAE